ncbi:MAG: glycosyltransferase family 2 protein [Cyanobacteria bacterium]|nr:glycosyltransferase family 2 protein [Cyanobacteriota bacterium]
MLTNVLTQYNLTANLGLLIASLMVLVRHVALLLWAEKGRKYDLVKKLYKVNVDYDVKVLIAFDNPVQISALLELLKALDEQEYPREKIQVHVGTWADWIDDLDIQLSSVKLQIWSCQASHKSGRGGLTPWLIDRCLANTNGGGLLVFLKPTDMVKPDFIQNVVSKGMDAFVLQGYVGSKRRIQTPWGQFCSLSSRLFNRVNNAGHYHLGMTARLLDTGWAIKQEVLEMIPYRQASDAWDTMEYTIRLNLAGFRVSWAPNVVVFSDHDWTLWQLVKQTINTVGNRLFLLTRYGSAMLLGSVMKMDGNLAELLFSTLTIPAFVLGSLFMLFMLTDLTGLTEIGSSITWGVLAVAVLVSHLLGMVVARAKPQDYWVTLFWTPVVYFLGALILPFVLISLVVDSVLKPKVAADKRYAAQATRFNEELPAVTHSSVNHDEAVGLSGLQRSARQQELPPLLEPQQPQQPSRTSQGPEIGRETGQETGQETGMIQPRAWTKEPRQTSKSIELSNGKKRLKCLLHTKTEFSAEGAATYQMTLEYKTVSFQTSKYRIEDQAFYELQAKLSDKGLTVMTCGSCGYFYNPTADVPDTMVNTGVCLYGKQGREVDLTTDAVTVVSAACEHHGNLAERDKIVRFWRDSLANPVP